MDYYASYYCNPFFYQDWRMFTPGPRYNYTIYTIYKVNNKTYFTLPIQEVLFDHHFFNGREFLAIAFTNSCGFVHNGAIREGQNKYKFRQDKYYQILIYTTLQYLRKKHHSAIEELQVILEVTDIQTNQKTYIVNE